MIKEGDKFFRQDGQIVEVVLVHFDLLEGVRIFYRHEGSSRTKDLNEVRFLEKHGRR